MRHAPSHRTDGISGGAAMPRIKLGGIADDFTGATDLANNLVRAGMRVVLALGVPDSPLREATDAVIIALKTRSVPASDAVQQSLDAAQWLRTQGADQLYFKYCSTFDSTSQGNIGPVIDALMQYLGAEFTIAAPAFPDNQRTVFKGHLFVGDALLSESGMQHHPLTPMTDANLVRVLGAQTRRRVGLLPHSVVAGGSAAIREALSRLQAEGVEIAIVDTLDNQDMERLAPALKDLPLITAASGIALHLPANWNLQPEGTALPARATGPCALLAGSCSKATRGQIATFIAAGHPALALDPLRIAAGEDVASEALRWALQHAGHTPALIYSTASPEDVRRVQAQDGTGQLGALIEAEIARIACGLVKRGVRRLVVAGGETSGAVVQALRLEQLQVGEQIDPGVPWCTGHSAIAGTSISIALKSGNFGSPEFFLKALG